MVKVLILRRNGKREVKHIKGYEEYQEAVGGNFELMPTLRGYVNPSQKDASPRRRLTCYANEEGMIRQLPSNPYAGVLSALGVGISFNMYVFGDVLVFNGFDNNGNEKSVDPYLIKLFEKYEACEDEDTFYCALEELNTRKKKKPVILEEKEKETKRKREEEPKQSLLKQG